MISVLLLFAFVMSFVVDFIERMIYNHDNRVKGEVEPVEGAMANNKE